MERHHDQPPAGRQQLRGACQRALDLAQLVVHPDAQRLEAAGRGIDAGAVGRQHAADDRRRGGAVVAIGASARAATMARAMRREARSSPKLEQQVGQLALRQRVDQVGRGRPDAVPCACRAAPRCGTRSRAPGRRAGTRRRRDRAPRRPARCTPAPASSASRSPKLPLDAGAAGRGSARPGRRRGRWRRDRGRSPTACRRRRRGSPRHSRRRRTCRRGRCRRRAAQRASTSASMTGMWPLACAAAGDRPGRAGHDAVVRGRVRPRSRARTRASARRRSAAAGSQIWKMRAEAHEHHRLGQPGMRREFIGQHDAPLLVGLDRVGVGVERRGEIVVLLAEQAVAVQRRRPGHRTGWPARPRCRGADATAAARDGVPLLSSPAFKAARNGAGTETRPLASSLF